MSDGISNLAYDDTTGQSHTENAGGTDASSPVVLSKVVTGTIKSALEAGGCKGEDSKNVACSVAEGQIPY